jgi:Leucine Rich Repeat.
LEGEIPKNLGQNRNLDILDLSNNKLFGEIPKAVFSSNKLSNLSLGSNSLGKLIPKELTKLRYLKVLNLFGNKFDTIEDGNFPNKYSYFNLGANYLSKEELQKLDVEAGHLYLSDQFV